MKILFVMALLFTHVGQAIEKNSMEIEEMYQLKIQHEREMHERYGHLDPLKILFFQEKSNMSCIEFAYRGHGVTRSQAIQMCRGVRSMDCVEFAYRGHGVTRSQAVKACKGRIMKECLEFAYRGHGVSRTQAVKQCRGVRSMECVEFAYRGHGVTRRQAIDQCRAFDDDDNHDCD